MCVSIIFIYLCKCVYLSKQMLWHACGHMWTTSGNQVLFFSFKGSYGFQRSNSRFQARQQTLLLNKPFHQPRFGILSDKSKHFSFWKNDRNCCDSVAASLLSEPILHGAAVHRVMRRAGPTSWHRQQWVTSQGFQHKPPHSQTSWSNGK